jgi:murein DD-endopeptidase MepM/ murein hydrolase activator NlpD
VKSYPSGIRHDYKRDALVSAPSSRRHGIPWFVLGLSVPIAGVSLLLVSQRNESKIPTPAQARTAAATAEVFLTAQEPVALAMPQVADAAPEPGIAESGLAGPVDVSTATLDLLVGRGDTLEILFRRNGLSVTDLAAMADVPEARDHLRQIRPGDHIVVTHDEGRVATLQRELSEAELLSLARTDTGFAAKIEQRAIDTRTVGAHGVIHTSLFEAGVAAGMADSVTMDMAYIFQWDIDFIQDVRVGDSFTVVYEELWRDGEKLRNGDIVAAEFINQGTVYRAARYRDSNGRTDYYTPDGRSVRKAFLRAPVEFTRISSNFNPSRRHPVLNTIRAHRGVDYAAPTGTPVIASGDGKVIARGVDGGYGNAVVLQHGGNITTLYGHLSRFGNQHIGSRVRQGEVIGYVGRTGLATGSHLHYEYRVGGIHKNPRTVPLPAADPVPAEDKSDFEVDAASLWRQLDIYQQVHVAAAAD